MPITTSSDWADELGRIAIRSERAKEALERFASLREYTVGFEGLEDIHRKAEEGVEEARATIARLEIARAHATNLWKRCTKEEG